MAKVDRLRAPRDPRDELAPEASWSDAHALLQVEVKAIDRLDVFAGDGETGPEAPDSVRADPELLVAWCERYAPQSVLDDKAALVQARNRSMADVIGDARRPNPKLPITPALVIEHLAARPLS